MYQAITIVGNLGKDPEMRYTPGGQAVTNFPLATNRTYTNSSGEKVEEVTWFRISAWGRQAETCNQYLNKGSRVLVEGRMSPDENGNPKMWEAQDGTSRANFDVTAGRVVFLSTRDEEYKEEKEEKQADFIEDEIPF